MSHPLQCITPGIRTLLGGPLLFPASIVLHVFHVKHVLILSEVWLGVWSVIMMPSCAPNDTFVLSFTPNTRRSFLAFWPECLLFAIILDLKSPTFFLLFVWRVPRVYCLSWVIFALFVLRDFYVSWFSCSLLPPGVLLYLPDRLTCVFYCHLKTYCGTSSEIMQSPE